MAERGKTFQVASDTAAPVEWQVISVMNRYELATALAQSDAVVVIRDPATNKRLEQIERWKKEGWGTIVVRILLKLFARDYGLQADWHYKREFGKSVEYGGNFYFGPMKGPPKKNRSK